MVQAEFLVIDWEGRPPRKPRVAVDETYGQTSSFSGQYGNAAEENAPNSAPDGVQARTILSRDHGSTDYGDPPFSVTSEDAALMASPSGNALGRRRTDTMYLADDLALAALDSVLSGDADVGILEHEVNEEASKDGIEPEAMESVDPFKDENEVTSSGDQDTKPRVMLEDLAVATDETHVTDVEDVPIEPAAPVMERGEKETPVKCN